MSHLTNKDKIARTLCGMPLKFETIGIDIYPVTIEKILDVGENNYHLYLTIITNFKKIIESLEIEKNEKELLKIDDFDLLIGIIAIYPKFMSQFKEAFSFFIPDYNIEYDDKTQLLNIVQNENSIEFNKESFMEFQAILKLQNYISEEEKEEEEEFRPANKKAAEMVARKKKFKADMDKAKAKEKESLFIADYISIISAKTNNLNLQEMKQMTAYAFFDCLQRLVAIDNYYIGVKQLMAGAKVEEVNLKHWLSKL